MSRLANTDGTSLFGNASRLCSLWMGESPRRERLENNMFLSWFKGAPDAEPAEHYVPPAADTKELPLEETEEGKRLVEPLYTKIKEMESDTQKKLKEIKELTTQHTECENRESKLTSELKRATEDIQTIRKACEAEQKNLRELLESEKATNQSKLKQKADTLQQLEGKLKSETVRIQELEAQLKKNEAKMRDNETKMREHKAKLEDKVSQLKKVFKNVNQNYTDLIVKKNKLERKMRHIEKQKRQWELKLKDVQMELKKEQNRNGSETKALKKYKEQCERKISNLQTRLKQLTTDKPLLPKKELEIAKRIQKRKAQNVRDLNDVPDAPVADSESESDTTVDQYPSSDAKQYSTVVSDSSTESSSTTESDYDAYLV